MGKILVVDDEDSMRMLITETLSLRDYEVLEATNGEDALKIIKEEEPNTILLDLMLPKMDGYDIIQQLKEDDLIDKSKIAILTAKGQAEEKELALQQGADYFLSKPFSPMDLLDLVKEINE
ncbi:MAG: response regulator [Halanaerobacter sp.]